MTSGGTFSHAAKAGEVLLSQLADVKVEAVSVAEGTVRIAARAQENASS